MIPLHQTKLIPNTSIPGVLTPLRIDPQPLIDIKEILGRFDYTKKDLTEILHLNDNILKPEIKKLFNDRGLEIEKIDVWKWSINSQKNVSPHTDGNYFNKEGRAAGINWGFDNVTGVNFYDPSLGSTTDVELKDNKTRSHTLWSYENDTQPLTTWNNKYPSLINPQIPHKIVGPENSYRCSITIKFLGNPSYNTVLEKLWDLREDIDFWPVDMNQKDVNVLAEMITRLEESMSKSDAGMSGYNLPRDTEIENFLKQFIKKPIKSMRIFNYKEGAGADLHIDYDNVLKESPTYGLNIPIFGSDNCYIDFYKNLGGIIEKWADSVGSFSWVEDESKVFHSSQLLINKPYLIRINIPHKVKITDNAKRKVLSVRFKDDYNDLPTDIVKFD